MKACQEELNPKCFASIGGRVIASDGMPVADARVMIVDGPPHTDIAALTSNDGRFRFDNLCSGTYKVLICADDYDPVTVAFPVQDREFIQREIRVGDKKA